MNKTDTFFIISNYNTDPSPYLTYCEDYIVYDQSTDIAVKEKLNKLDLKISFVENSGHNITDYFRFFIDNYDSLPPVMMLLKGNIIGRHVTQDYFDQVYNNKYYTPLYNDRKFVERSGIAYQLYDGAFLEVNNAWYKESKSFRYFQTYNELLSFIFKDPIIPEWLFFSPGACYIVTKDHVKKYPKIFFENLKYLIGYTYFPLEAYHVERMLHIIFCGSYCLNDHMLNEDKFLREISSKASEVLLKKELDKKKPIFIKKVLNKFNFDF